MRVDRFHQPSLLSPGQALPQTVRIEAVHQLDPGAGHAVDDGHDGDARAAQRGRVAFSH